MMWPKLIIFFFLLIFCISSLLIMQFVNKVEIEKIKIFYPEDINIVDMTVELIWKAVETIFF